MSAGVIAAHYEAIVAPSTELFYLPSSGAGAVSPAFDALWDLSAQADVLAMVKTPINTALTVKQAGESVSGLVDVLNRQYVGPNDLPAGTRGASFRLVLPCGESTVTADMWLQLVLKVVSGDGSTVRGVLFSGVSTTVASAVSTDPNYEFDSATRKTRLLSGSLTPVASSAGDRLVAEIGYRDTNANTSGRVGSQDFGDSTSATDHAFTVDVTVSSSLRPWLEITW